MSMFVAVLSLTSIILSISSETGYVLPSRASQRSPDPASLSFPSSVTRRFKSKLPVSSCSKTATMTGSLIVEAAGMLLRALKPAVYPVLRSCTSRAVAAGRFRAKLRTSRLRSANGGGRYASAEAPETLQAKSAKAQSIAARPGMAFNSHGVRRHSFRALATGLRRGHGERQRREHDSFSSAPSRYRRGPDGPRREPSRRRHGSFGNTVCQTPREVENARHFRDRRSRKSAGPYSRVGRLPRHRRQILRRHHRGL